MQLSHPAKNPGHQAAAAVSRDRDEPLSDRALVALLGGVYLGGLAAFWVTVYGVSQLL
jgi:hypothetical protein